MITIPLSIVSADYLENYKIALTFNDEKEVVTPCVRIVAMKT